jgi:hypothetical protein
MGGLSHPPKGNGTRNNPDAGTVDNRATSGLITLTEGITIINGNRERGIHMNRHDGPNGDKETTKKETGEVAKCRESSESWLKKGGCRGIH